MVIIQEESIRKIIQSVEYDLARETDIYIEIRDVQHRNHKVANRPTQSHHLVTVQITLTNQRKVLAQSINKANPHIITYRLYFKWIRFILTQIISFTTWNPINIVNKT